MATGLLLINLGTPEEPTPPAVRRYLREFLSDPRVIDINPVGRALLLNLIILPFRPKKSAHAYQAIWDKERGSPLFYHSRDLADAVAKAMGDDWKVELVMRYGSPSIPEGLDALRRAGVDHIVVLPLFPQYASSSTGTALARVFEVAGQQWNTPWLSVVPPFYEDPGFLRAFAAVARAHKVDSADHVLMSFHGLPERHIRKSDPSGAHCLAQSSCCDRIVDANRNCYRAQCYATARGLAALLDLPADRYTVCFQSRLGRTPWIRPYTDEVIDQLAKAKTKHLAVLCPAFVADCLETIEEIGMRARQQFQAAGGQELTMIPSLNSSPEWVSAVAALARRAGAASV
ncbi:MAG: ferrochelatase [Myxococcales bacterium]|nr:ferrochelatase [Myxococcales bacterium]